MWSFRSITRLILPQSLLKIAEGLTSLERHTHPHIHLSCREVNHDINAIATKLHRTNSYFSFIEIWEDGPSGEKYGPCANEVFGVFHHTESVSMLIFSDPRT